MPFPQAYHKLTGLCQPLLEIYVPGAAAARTAVPGGCF